VKLNHKLPQSFIVKHSDKANSPSHLRVTEGKVKKNIEGEQHLKLISEWWVEHLMPRQCSTFMWCSILKQESNLDIEIHRKHPLRWKISSPGLIKKDDSPCKVSIKYDDLWDHLVSEAEEGTKCRLIFASFASSPLRVSTLANFKVEFPNEIPGLHFWIVAEVRYHGYCEDLDFLLKSKCRLVNVTWVPLIHE